MRRSATFVLAFVTAIILGVPPPASAQTDPALRGNKLGPLARSRAARTAGWSRVILRAAPGASMDDVATLVREAGGVMGRKLKLIDAQAAFLPNSALQGLVDSPIVDRVSLDRPIVGAMERTGGTVGAADVRQALGYDGTGVGVAIIDSGVTGWHDDLGATTGGTRVTRFVDFVQGRSWRYDDYGHGTHVAGIIAGNGYDSGGRRTGIAPNANLVVLKVLDSKGRGRVSTVIAALDYIVENKDALNIRVVNLSLSTGVYESYDTDPLTQAAKRAVQAGIVVVAAAGNAGRTQSGQTQYGAVMAPGNAPWVLTVGASSHNGTNDLPDDEMARFSSRGPSAIDFAAKPDLVAPGVGIESLSSPGSTLYNTKSDFLLSGTVTKSYLPYLSLSGTSMAAPVVTGTVALMLQAHPSLTPNQVKAILQYTTRVYRGYDRLSQGAGFLNAKGAVELSRFLAAPNSTLYPNAQQWSRQMIWGNHLVRGGMIAPEATAWATDVTWGATRAPDGQPIEWGAAYGGAGLWGVTCSDEGCTSPTWGGAGSRNVVWGAMCGGADCQTAWSLAAGRAAYVASADDETVVWGSNDDETVVWGSNDDETVVWGSNADETVVWGSDDDETVVWGSNGDETVVWGSSCNDGACEPVLWSNE